MNKIDFIGGGGAGGGGITSASGDALLPRDEFAASGNKGGIPLSGTIFGASSQVYISGIAVGPFAGQGVTNASGTNLLPRNEFVTSGNTFLQVVPVNITPSGSGLFSVGTPSKPFASGDFGLLEASQLLPPNASGGNVGSTGAYWQAVYATSGNFPSGVVIKAPNSSGWLIGVDNSGLLTSTGPFISS